MDFAERTATSKRLLIAQVKQGQCTLLGKALGAVKRFRLVRLVAHLRLHQVVGWFMRRFDSTASYPVGTRQRTVRDDVVCWISASDDSPGEGGSALKSAWLWQRCRAWSLVACGNSFFKLPIASSEVCRHISSIPTHQFGNLPQGPPLQLGPSGVRQEPGNRS